MSKTSTGWKLFLLGHLAKKFVSGGTPPTGVGRYWTGQIPWVTGADFGTRGIDEVRRFVSDEAIAETATNVVESGQLLVVTRTGVGKLAIAPCDIAISQDITGIYVDAAQVNAEFLYHRMKLAVEDLKKLNQGTSINGIVRNDLVKYEILLPETLGAQEAIAKILSTIDHAIAQTEALIAKLQQIKAGLMQDLFTRGVTPDGKLRPPREEAPDLYQQSPLGWIPIGWEVGLIRDIFDIQLGKMLNKLAKSGRHPAPYVGNRAVQWDKVDMSAAEEMDFSPTERQKYCLKKGDLLVCEGGDVGRTAIWEEEIEDCFYQKAIHRLRPRDERMKPGVMLRFMRFAKTNGYFAEFTSQSSIAHLTQEKLGSISILVPQRVEQELMLTHFDSCDARILLENLHLSSLHQQKRGLMQDLLTGPKPQSPLC